jgi:eukaryotic-like serine/threonine-protein kinase
LLREASVRLGILSVVGAALWVLGTALGHVALTAAGPQGGPPWYALVLPTDAIAGVSALFSLALFGFTRRPGSRPEVVINLGLAYMILTSLALGLMFHLGPVAGANQSVQPEITWIGVVVLMFAAIVPSAPKKTLIAGLVAASMNPIGMLIARSAGQWDFGPASNVLLMHYPDYLIVGVAVVVSRVVTQLGRKVTKERELGSYQVGELLGSGGMGEVYRATHRMLARPAAIKLIRPETLAGGDGEDAQLAVKRFSREAEAAASLRSPHTVEVYDFGVTDDETLYYVMELLDGMDLESMVDRYGPLPAGRAIYTLRQVCESLGEAHARGLVHRDIKPANIHVGRVALRHDFVKVLDFGLVKPMASANGAKGASAEHSLATAAGFVPGTPAYMPPEMALGEAVDGRADVYAVGCVAYYMLTGRLVFEAGNSFQMIVKHLDAEPVPPSQRAEQLVPPALDEVVLACLAKKPDDRPQTAAALARSLAAAADDAEPWGEEQAAQWWAALDEGRLAAVGAER